MTMFLIEIRVPEKYLQSHNFSKLNKYLYFISRSLHDVILSITSSNGCIGCTPVLGEDKRPCHSGAWFWESFQFFEEREQPAFVERTSRKLERGRPCLVLWWLYSSSPQSSTWSSWSTWYSSTPSWRHLPEYITTLWNVWKNRSIGGLPLLNQQVICWSSKNLIDGIQLLIAMMRINALIFFKLYCLSSILFQ